MIPRLQQYNIIIWIDGNVIIKNSYISLYIISQIYNNNENVLLFEHYRYGSVYNEYLASMQSIKYENKDELTRQYNEYITNGYSDMYWRNVDPDRPQYGMWVTSFIAYDMRNENTLNFLYNWYIQTLLYTNQDQISLSYVCQMLHIHPYSFPDNVIMGTHSINSWFKKIDHGL
jgi:hypothetical protein